MNRFRHCINADEVVFQAIGAGSVCWENPGGAGVFDSIEAKSVGDQALERLRELGLT